MADELMAGQGWAGQQEILQLRERGAYREALQHLEQQLADGVQAVDALALRLQLLLLLGAMPAAQQALATALALAPQHPAVLRNQARFLLRAGDAPGALAAAHAAFQASGGSLEDATVLASALGAVNRNEEALGLINQVLQVAPDYPEALATRALQWFKSGDAARACDDAAKALQFKPFMRQLWPLYARLALQLGRKTEARNALRESIVDDPDNGQLLVNLGELERAAGHYQDALELLQKALLLEPSNLLARCNLGVVLQELGRLDEAERQYRAILIANPGELNIQTFLGQLLRQQGRYPEARDAFKELVARCPGDASALTNLGVLENDCKNFAAAEAALTQALAIDPSLPEARGALANALRAQGQLAAALHEAQVAVAAKPETASLQQTLGNLLKESGMDPVEHYQQAYELEPESPAGLDSAVKLAVLSYLAGDLADVRLWLEKASSLAASNDKLLAPSRGYWRYLSALLDYLRQRPEPTIGPATGVLHVIGESHSLSPHGQLFPLDGGLLKAGTHWIEGCKLWHLGRPDENKYQQQFRRIAMSLPEQSNVLLCVGEIDCRWDAPLMRRLQKGGDLVAAVDQMVSAAFDWMNAAAGVRGHRMIVCGVPATQAKLPEDPEVGALFLSLVKYFNTAMARESSRRNWYFLDVFALTDRGDAISNARWHVDSYHLRPDALFEAFANGYLRKSS